MVSGSVFLSLPANLEARGQAGKETAGKVGLAQCLGLANAPVHQAPQQPAQPPTQDIPYKRALAVQQQSRPIARNAIHPARPRAPAPA